MVRLVWVEVDVETFLLGICLWCLFEDSEHQFPRHFLPSWTSRRVALGNSEARLSFWMEDFADFPSRGFLVPRGLYGKNFVHMTSGSLQYVISHFVSLTTIGAC